MDMVTSQAEYAAYRLYNDYGPIATWGMVKMAYLLGYYANAHAAIVAESAPQKIVAKDHS